MIAFIDGLQRLCDIRREIREQLRQRDEGVGLLVSADVFVIALAALSSTWSTCLCRQGRPCGESAPQSPHDPQ